MILGCVPKVCFYELGLLYLDELYLYQLFQHQSVNAKTEINNIHYKFWDTKHFCDSMFRPLAVSSGISGINLKPGKFNI